MTILRNKHFLLGLVVAAGFAVLAPLTAYPFTQPILILTTAILVRLLPLGLAVALRSRLPLFAQGLLWGWLAFIAAPFAILYLLALTGGVMDS